ncbi:transmembrane protease serine 9-like [Toxorhynchites rutilus septentrionalis]|uniref:transmembrane protease serine 9-like n=1 Tax=Toxorhynchites rutilus septentrionalis TaxID=329112 RepID=UPI002479F05B|nr:transmembrane protease serine 9-like [Toxorhynchites rutilus septentrionalis]
MLNIWLLILFWLQIRITYQQDDFKCGVPQMTRTKLIVQGSDTVAGEWPWHVAIYQSSRRETKYVCGGTLISEQFVLTAAHCVTSKENGYQLAAGRLFVRLGVLDLDALNTQTLQQHGIERIHKYANFSNGSLNDDIALLELNTLAQFNKFVQPACVNQVENLVGENMTAIGWGLTEDDEISAILKKAQMPAVEDITCLKSNRELFGNALDEGIFCAGYANGTSVCNGDSGGGLFMKRDNVWYLAGIVSFSESRSGNSKFCRTDGYAAFTKVQKYLPWIIKITKLHFLLGQGISPSDNDRNDNCKAVNPEAPSNHLPMNCGSYLMNRISGGEKANVFEFPWMALLKYNQGFLCLGSLISKRYVLTAALCVRSELIPSGVRLGEHTIDQVKDCNVFGQEIECSPPVRDYGIECIIIHPEYSRRTKGNDIALIRLNKDVIFEDHIQPICLPVTSALQNAKISKYIIAGWGKTEYGDNDLSKILLKASVLHANKEECMSWMNLSRVSFNDNQICAGGNSTNACGGDGGGPLGYVMKHRGIRFVQFGITSFGVGCGNYPSVYTRVSSFMDWITAHVTD